jgi:RNA-directed DNA polymerase
MKTHNQLFERICSFPNLLAAAHEASRGKRLQDSVGKFRTRLEAEVLALGEELRTRSHVPGPYREKFIAEPKKRMISVAPFRDRVVHHALCAVVMPLFERRMIFDLYSNRAGKGTHAAIRRAQHYAKRHPFVLKCDVRKYFPSIDHAVLKETFRRTIRCEGALWLLDTIVDASNAQEPVCTVYPGDDLAQAAVRRVGLPIGNLTSQWFGCVHLDEFDHWVKETLRCPGYMRYVDDFILFADDKAQLAEWRAAIVERLAGVRLRLNEGKSRVYQCREGLSFLGQRVWPEQRRILRENVARARRRLRWNVRQHLRGEMTQEELLTRWMSWKGHALQADTGGLVERIRLRLVEDLAQRDNAPIGCCAAARGIMTPPTCAAPSATTTGRRTPTPISGSGVRGGFGEAFAPVRAEHTRLRAQVESHPKAHPLKPVHASHGCRNEHGKSAGAGSPQGGTSRHLSVREGFDSELLPSSATP